MAINYQDNIDQEDQLPGGNDAANDQSDDKYNEDKDFEAHVETTDEDEGIPSLTTQGDYKEQEENLGGSTNLSLDQLKKEGDIENSDVSSGT